MINPEERRRILMQKIKKVHKGRVTAILVAAMLIVGAVLPSIADTADTFEKDGLRVNITTDKAAYDAGEEINAEITVKNTSAEDRENVIIKVNVPDGLKLADGSKTDFKIGTMSAGAQKTENVKFKTEKSPGGDTEEPTGGDTEEPSSGDTEKPSDGDTEKPSGSDTEKPSGGDTEKPSGSEGSIEIDKSVVKDGAPSAIISASAEELEKAVPLTKEEQDAVKGGAAVKVYLQIQPAVPTDDERAIIEAKKADFTIGAYIDISMFKTVGGGAPSCCSQLNSKIKVSITIPENLRNTDSSIVRTYQLIRRHGADEEAEILTGEYNKETFEFSFETDRFSTYAIAYKDSKAADGGANGGTNGSTGSNTATGDINFMGYFIAVLLISAVIVILIKRKNNKEAGIIGTMALTLIGCGLAIQMAYAAIASGRFEVSKTITVDGKQKTISAQVSYGEKVAEVDVTGSYRRVSVHDPSIVKDHATGTYYVFGSHMAWAKSTDLINWTTFTNNINRDFRTLFAKEAEWAARGGKNSDGTDYDVAGNLWAPDVIYNDALGKWCMYMSVNGNNWYTSVALLTADSLEGDWTYEGTVVYSGFMNAGDAALTDLKAVIGTNEVPDRYKANRNGNHTYGMNAIDPCVEYDEDGNLWMAYGSWFGGIYMIKLDNNTGLRDYSEKYETAANTSDEYQGLKLAGGEHCSGEAAYLEKIDNHWYLFLSYGGLVANGGYNMRVFRADDIKGPYKDASGDDARYTAGTNNINGKTGVKLFGNYKWTTMKVGQVAQGHNSAFVDSDGKAYVVYHTRFADGTEGHQVRVHQLFVNQDGWLVAAPYEYTGETLSDTAYTMEQMSGLYEVIFHNQSINYQNLECMTPQNIALNDDGTVSGDQTGTWSADADKPYVTITLGTKTYKGVFVEQYVEETTNKTLCFTLLGSDEVEVWGSKAIGGKTAVDMTLNSGVIKIPQQTVSDITFKTEGLQGTTVSYASGNTAVLSNDGKVTRGSDDVTVKVTATFTNGDYSVDKEYEIKVLGDKGEDERLLVGSWFTDGEADLSNAAEGTYSYPNPFNKTVTNGLEIYNGAVIEFDVEGSGAYLSTILSFFGGGRMYFTGGSYLGYNATGGFFDANVKNSEPWAAGTNFISGKTHFEIKLKGTGFEVYANGIKAYDSADLDAGNILGSKDPNWGGYANVLKWLNNTAETLNLGWGSWWNDKFNGKISNVKLWAEPVERIDTSAYIYYQDYSNGDLSEWNGLTNALSVVNDGGDKGNYLKFNTGTDSGNRGVYAAFSYDDGKTVPDKYTITMETSLTAGVLTQRSVSAFAILGTDAVKHNGNEAVSSGYILKLYNEPPAGTAANQTNTSQQKIWKVNDSDKTVEIPVGEWVTVKAQVDTTVGKAKVTISKADGTSLFDEVVDINGGGKLSGLQILRGRGVGTASVDTIKVSDGIEWKYEETPEEQLPTTITAAVTGKAYPDKAGEVTVTFTGDDKNIPEGLTLKINGEAASKDTTVGLAKVKSITYSGKTCTVALTMNPMNGWHKLTGSYDVELAKGSKSLAAANFSYEMEMSPEHGWTQIATTISNDNVGAWYKVDGTKLSVMTLVKMDKIHCDNIAAGGKTYAWYDGIVSELYMTYNGTKYNVGSHVYNDEFANPITWNNNATLVNSKKSVRSYMAIGTFDNDEDIDKGCALLNTYDLSDIGITGSGGVKVTFSGLIGPNDSVSQRCEAVNESIEYTLIEGTGDEEIEEPEAMYLWDFSNGLLSTGTVTGSSTQAVIIGKGNLIADDERGQVFNNATGETAGMRENYLSLPKEVGSAIAASKNSAFTVAIG